MNSREIRNKFIAFFERRGHAVIPSASLVPENDPSVLFITAGMQPLVPYLLGERHPNGKRLVNIQKCVRTQDIEEVGDKTHDTFFEMMGNWSLGDYFKKEAIEWSYDLLTSKTEGFGLDKNRLYFTVFEGNSDAPKDDESAEIWKSLGVPADRIYYLPENKNWWSAGDNGPSGPDTEMFYDISKSGLGTMSKEEFLAADERQDVVEIWNDVFMEYLREDGKIVGKLQTRNVDTGSGLERVAMILQGKDNVFETDLFLPIVEKIKELADVRGERAERIIADHIRTAVMLISDGVEPSNSDRGYILRRLLRRAIRFADTLGVPAGSLALLTDSVSLIYEGVYKNVGENLAKIQTVINEEEKKFRKTLQSGLKKLEFLAHKLDDNNTDNSISRKKLSGLEAFDLHQTYGFPIELTIEICNEMGIEVDVENYKERFIKHQELSRVGAQQKFKGGLSGAGEKERKYHTATHLLHQALRTVLGDSVRQRGSNITPERLRFDFEYFTKLTEEQKTEIENLVNQKIQENLPVSSVSMPIDEAKETGALHFFGDTYGDIVSIYYIGSDLKNAYSKEFCGGPHVERTGLLGNFAIIKEEAVSSGVRRIKGVLTE
jgi:alanyl-tRNA synthetase